MGSDGLDTSKYYEIDFCLFFYSSYSFLQHLCKGLLRSLKRLQTQTRVSVFSWIVYLSEANVELKDQECQLRLGKQMNKQEAKV